MFAKKSNPTPMSLNRYLRWLAIRRITWMGTGIIVLCLLIIGVESRRRYQQRNDRVLVQLKQVINATTVLAQRLDESGEVMMIQLAGLNVPEPWQTSTRQWMTQTCAEQSLLVVLDDSNVSSNAKFISVLVYLPDGQLLNEMMVAEGFAKCHPGYQTGLGVWLARLESRASYQKAGLWAMSFEAVN